MSDHVLLNLLNKLRESNKMCDLPQILSHFSKEFNKFNTCIARAGMLDSFII